MCEKFRIEGKEKEYVTRSVRIQKSLWEKVSEMSERTGCPKSRIINLMIKYAAEHAE